GNSGGSLPGSSGNGLSVGFQIGGAADSENSYLVEGQDTENISGGASQANVPFEFIQEVQVKTSGIQAEHGGALGGVVNVVMQKGSNAWHGSLFTTYNSDVLTGTAPGVSSNGQSGLRYDPTFTATAANPEPDAQQYDPDRKSTRLNSSHVAISYAVFCLKKKKSKRQITPLHLPLIHHNLCGRPISQTENF